MCFEWIIDSYISSIFVFKGVVVYSNCCEKYSFVISFVWYESYISIFYTFSLSTFNPNINLIKFSSKIKMGSELFAILPGYTEW